MACSESSPSTYPGFPLGRASKGLPLAGVTPSPGPTRCDGKDYLLLLLGQCAEIVVHRHSSRGGCTGARHTSYVFVGRGTNRLHIVGTYTHTSATFLASCHTIWLGRVVTHTHTRTRSTHGFPTYVVRRTKSICDPCTVVRGHVCRIRRHLHHIECGGGSRPSCGGGINGGELGGGIGGKDGGGGGSSDGLVGGGGGARVATAATWSAVVARAAVAMEGLVAAKAVAMGWR